MEVREQIMERGTTQKSSLQASTSAKTHTDNASIEQRHPTSVLALGLVVPFSAGRGLFCLLFDSTGIGFAKPIGLVKCVV